MTARKSANRLRGRLQEKAFWSLEPAAAVSHPPGDAYDGNGRAQRPPERQNEIGSEPEHGERDPEDLALHILDCRSFPPPAIPATGLQTNFGYACGQPPVETGLAPSPLDAAGNAASPSLYDQVLGLSSSITL